MIIIGIYIIRHGWVVCNGLKSAAQYAVAGGGGSHNNEGSMTVDILVSFFFYSFVHFLCDANRLYFRLSLLYHEFAQFGGIKNKEKGRGPGAVAKAACLESPRSRV